MQLRGKFLFNKKLNQITPCCLQVMGRFAILAWLNVFGVFFSVTNVPSQSRRSLLCPPIRITQGVLKAPSSAALQGHWIIEFQSFGLESDSTFPDECDGQQG